MRQTLLQEGRRTIVFAVGAAIVLAIGLVAVRVWYGSEPGTLALNIVFGAGWGLVLALLVFAGVYRQGLAGRERQARTASAEREVGAREGAAEAAVFPGPPVVALLRLLALVVLYGGGGIFLVAGIASLGKPDKEPMYYVVSAVLAVVLATALAVAIVALHRVGNRWKKGS